MRAIEIFAMSGVLVQLVPGCVQEDMDSASEPVNEREYTWGYTDDLPPGEETSGAESPVEGAGAGPCADIRAADPFSGDGDYAVVVAGRSLVVTCVDMATSPKEYLTLPNTEDANYSEYGTGQNTSSPAVRTQYTRVRLHPADLTVDITDRRFSASNGGWAQFGASYHYAWNYAHAADCHSVGSHTGRANIDLTGTPFAVAADQFVVLSTVPNGTITYSADDKVVDLTGGGYCGDTLPANFRLQLRWAD